MANVDAPRGAIPAYHLSGGVIRAQPYTIASGYSTSIFTGDFVTQAVNGTITQAVADTGLILGVFQGCSYKDSTTGEQKYSPYWPASTSASDIVAYVIDDPDVIFIMQHDGTPTDPDDRGANYEITVGTGSTVNGTSAMEIDTSEIKATTGHIRALRPVPDPGNDGSAANADWFVRVVEHAYRQETGLTT